MCAIAGLFDTRSSRPVDEALLRRMNERQRHRGPDGHGVHVEPGAGLAHRRLSIIDLEGGGQPQYNEDGSVAVVFNGEIYNYRALRSELQARGHRFATASDTEVIVHGWEEWQEGVVDRLRGMFAFAILDRPRQRLLLARDRLGVKPLFYALLPDGVLIFASELKALLAHPGLPRALDPRRVEDFFAFGYVPDPGTILRSACKLEPGHLLSVVRNQPVPAPRRYWDIAFTPRRIESAEEAAAELLERFRDAVAARLVADVPLGAFLSGGIDSSAVVAMMATMGMTGMTSEATGMPVTTCSIAFHDQAFDESRHAARVAERYRTRHHVETVDADERLPLDELAALYDEPFADSSAIPTYQVSRIARRHVTVALSGDGGDESLAGYRRYPQYLAHEGLRSLVPLPLRGMAKGAAQMLAAAAGLWSGMPGQTTLSALSSDAADGYLELISLTRTLTRRRLFGSALTRDLQGYHAREVLRRHARNAPTDSALSAVQYLDFKTYLPGDILTKVDRASMAHGLEVRSPFLDHALVEWLAGIPPDLKLRDGEGKHLLKRALGNHLPGEILDRPKAGFAVPLSRWLRGPLRTEAWRAIESEVLADTRLLDRAALRRLMQEHEAARRDHASLLWAVMMFEASLRQLEGVSSRGAASVSPPAA